MDHFNIHARRYNSLTEPTRIEPQSSPYLTPRTIAVKINLKVRKPTSHGGSQASTDEEPPFMATTHPRRKQNSLSPIGNGQLRKSDRQSEPICSLLGDLRENTAWETVNREIAEWQTICETGRPSWWSPVSHRSSSRILSPTWQKDIYSIPVSQVLANKKSRQARKFEPIRRAVTENYLTDNNQVHDMAQMIAVQLLGACFTLPPDHVASYTPTGQQNVDNQISHEMPDSRLISTLRMHTESRYSPAFGYQARNTSPTTVWQAALDGTAATESPTESSETSSLIGGSERIEQKRRTRKPLNVTEASSNEFQPEGNSGQQPEPSNLVFRSNLRQHNLGKILLPERDTSIFYRNQHTRSYPELSSPAVRDTADHDRTKISIQSRSAGNSEPQSKRRSLRAIIRSEPHPISIQPVRELVVKRWQTIRRRFGHSLSHGSADSGSAAEGFVASNPVTQIFPNANSHGDASSRHSSDGKERRRRARERGYIHSSSTDSVALYNTPTGLSPISPHRMRTNTGRFSYADPLVAAVMIATRSISGRNLNSNQDRLSSGQTTPPVTTNLSSSEIKYDPNTFPIPYLDPTRLSAPATEKVNQTKTQKTAHRRERNRRSRLSEVCTPDECEERSLLSALGSTLCTPSSEKTSAEMTRDESSHTEATTRISEESTRLIRLSESQLEQLHKIGMTPLEEVTLPDQGVLVQGRPRMWRTSTSGTQLFKPNKDGVEVDGLPVGPTADAWDQEDEKKGKRIRSFLCVM